MTYSLPQRAVLLLAALAALAGVGPAYAAALDITGAWLRQPPPGQTGAAIYMELHNGGTAPLAVVGARAEIAPKLRARLAGIADSVSLTHNRCPDPGHWADVVRALKADAAKD